jgi:hypothetical protein
MPKNFTTEDFVKRSESIHGKFYNYSNVVYTNMHTKVNIVDPEYGEFWQTPMGHVQGQGHPLRGRLKAGKSRRLSLEEFITRSQEKHGNLYDYSKVEYKHIDHKVCIIDPEYGEFWQTPYQHLNSHGCPARTANKEWIINYDHIIPLSIVHSSKRKNNEWNKDRPLYKFLNSEINLKPVTAKYNKEKTDTVIINDKTVSASSLRNNYVAIGYLIQTILQIDATEILVQDQQFVMNYLGLS